MRPRSRLAGWRTRQSTLKLAVPVTASEAAPAFPGPAVVADTTRTATAAVPTSYPAVATHVAILLLALIAARLTEIIPGARVIHPSLSVAIIGGGLVFLKASGALRLAAAKNIIVRAFFFYGLWGLITAPFAIWPGQAVKSLYPAFIPGLMLILVLSACPPTLRALDLVTRGLIIAYAVQFLSAASDSLVFRGRLYGSGSLDPNDLASCAALIFPAAIMHFARRPRFRNLPMLLMALLSVYIVGQTASRGGAIAFVGGLLALIAVMRWRARAVAIVAIIVGLPIAWSLAPPTFVQRISTLTKLDEDYNATEYDGRSAVWKRGLGYVAAHPVSGVGLNNFETAEGNTLTSKGQHGKWSAAHNTYIQVFAELGIVGGIIFCVMLGLAVRTFAFLARRPDRADDRPEFVAALIGWAVGALFLSQAYFWGLFGLLALAALGASIRRQASDPHRQVRVRMPAATRQMVRTRSA